MNNRVIPVGEVVPFEEDDPELGRLLAWHSNVDERKLYEAVRRSGIDRAIDSVVRIVNGRVWILISQLLKPQDRNAKCICGSGRKAKKCCG